MSLVEQFPRTVGRYRAQVAAAADRVAGIGSAGLEALVRPVLVQGGTVEEGELIQVLQRMRPGLHWAKAAAVLRVADKGAGQ